VAVLENGERTGPEGPVRSSHPPEPGVVRIDQLAGGISTESIR
jgi:hypothetical protein